MISRTAKALFYKLAGPFMRGSSFLYRTFRSPGSMNIQRVKVHLGPGQEKYLKGWINVDANFISAKIDVWSDLRHKLPFRDNSVDVFYSHHLIEHLPNLSYHFQELYRCLKPGGFIRMGGPNGDSAIQKFVEKDSEWFGDFPDKRTSIGGRFENFIFCRQEHLTILTFSFLDELLEKTGFIHIRKCLPVKETNHPAWIDVTVLSTEWESDFDTPHTLLIEAVKKK